MLNFQNEQTMITQCPRLLIPPGIWTVLDFVELAMERNWPIAGGVLDQSHSFLRAYRFVSSEIAHWKNKSA